MPHTPSSENTFKVKVEPMSVEEALRIAGAAFQEAYDIYLRGRTNDYAAPVVKTGAA